MVHYGSPGSGAFSTCDRRACISGCPAGRLFRSPGLPVSLPRGSLFSATLLSLSLSGWRCFSLELEAARAEGRGDARVARDLLPGLPGVRLLDVRRVSVRRLALVPDILRSPRTDRKGLEGRGGVMADRRGACAASWGWPSVTPRAALREPSRRARPGAPQPPVLRPRRFDCGRHAPP